MKALDRERKMLSKLIRKRFSEAERTKLYQKWSINVNSKRRRLQLANQLWSKTGDTTHVMDSATIVAKLIRFVEQGRIKETFGLSFSSPSMRRRSSFGWKNSMASLF
ncbi:hypothetical protein ACFE04_001641 [Oxalis oulophora]